MGIKRTVAAALRAGAFWKLNDLAQYTCWDHIVVGPMSLPDHFEDVSTLHYAKETSRDETEHMNSAIRHGKSGKTTHF